MQGVADPLFSIHEAFLFFPRLDSALLGAEFSNSLHRFSPSAPGWTQLNTTGSAPSARMFAEMDYMGGSLYVFGGTSYAGRPSSHR